MISTLHASLVLSWTHSKVNAEAFLCGVTNADCYHTQPTKTLCYTKDLE